MLKLKNMDLALQDMFQLQCLIKNIKVKLCARIERGVKQLIALVTNDEDIVCHYSFGELPTVLKRIPWYTSRKKTIKAICFDPTATWLLVTCVDGSLHIIPFLSLVDKNKKVDCKWSTTDVTHFPRPSQCPDCEPTSLVWWQTLDCNQNGLIGFENGTVALISLTDGRCLATCTVNESITQLIICQDNSLDAVFLLINGSSGQQWKHILEQHSLGYIWPPESVNNSDESAMSKLYHLKQMGVDKLFSLKQRLVDGKNSKKDNISDSTSESSINSEYSFIGGPELLPHLSDTYFNPQYARNRFLFTAFYKPASLLTVHAVDVETAPLYSYKLPNGTSEVLLTDKLVFALSDDRRTLQIVSSNLSECRSDGDSEFNAESKVAQFEIEDDEEILKLYKLSDHKLRKNEENRHKLFEMPKSIDELNISKPKVDMCIFITSKNVYKVNFSITPTEKFIHCIMEENDYDKAQKLADIFGLNVQQLLESCGDLFLAQEAFHSGIILYKQAKLHMLKRVLKLAISSDCKTLLKFVHLCLGSSKVDMSIATKIHIGNLAVMAYTELILRYGGTPRLANTKDFMSFLKYEEFYDQILAVNVACQAAQWKLVNLLAKSRGLQPEVVSAFGQILQSVRAPKATDLDFMFSLSEPSLTQSLLLEPKNSEIILKFIRNNVSSFPEEILRRFIVQLDPSQPCAIPLVSRNFNSHKSSLSLESTLDSNENENHDNSVTVKNFIETFILVLLHLIKKFDSNIFSLDYLEKTQGPSENVRDAPLKKFPPIRSLSCGYEHAAIVRNDVVYTMGLSNAGCLGLGPLLSQSTPPRLVQTLSSLNVKGISVSCGRKHTLFLTDYGVYSCGSNKYGQLGLGGNIHISPYPQIISCLSHLKIVEVICGQYHSLALTSCGIVYTWGWGIHGQLGHGSCNNELYPKELKFQKKIKQIAAGHAHSLILSEDGEIFGFGSNAFGQLEGEENGKRYNPVRVRISANITKPIVKISSAYFHNIAVSEDHEVYVWGASPQEVRFIQAKSHQKTNGIIQQSPDSWKQSVNIYSSSNKGNIEEISVGYRHSAILHNGKILWGKTKEGNLSEPHLREQDTLNIFNYRFLHVSCGLDYTMAIDHIGRLLAWGSVSMAQTLLGRLLDDRKNDEKIIISKNTRRILKFPNNIGNVENFPIEVPGLPTMAITFNPSDHRLIFARTDIPYAILKVENPEMQSFKNEFERASFDDLQYCPRYNLGHKTLHYVLETYYSLYDSDNIQQICVNVQNYQAASKIALLGEHFCDSLSLQLKAFGDYLKLHECEIKTFFNEYESSIQVEKLENPVGLLKNIGGCFSERFNAQQISTSSSLDSIRQWDEQEHQGGRESPCESGEIEDIRNNMTQFVQSLKNNQIISPISCVSSLISDANEQMMSDKFLEIKDEHIREITSTACYIVEFYIKKIYRSENHILMQNVLMQIIEFWLSSSFPVIILENVLLKNLDKYFYPLSILLFCKDFSNESDEEVSKSNDIVEQKSARFLKEFSTKFCLQLCLMVVENVNKT